MYSTCCLYGAGLNDSDGGHWKGWALKTETFLGPEMATSEVLVAFRPKKSRDFQGPPLPMARVMDLPQSQSLSPSATLITGTLVILCT